MFAVIKPETHTWSPFGDYAHGESGRDFRKLHRFTVGKVEI